MFSLSYVCELLQKLQYCKLPSCQLNILLWVALVLFMAVLPIFTYFYLFISQLISIIVMVSLTVLFVLCFDEELEMLVNVLKF